MTKRKQQPFKKLIDKRSPLPLSVIEHFAVFEGLIDVMLHLLGDGKLTSDEHDFIHVPETTVIEIRRSDGEGSIVDQEQFGVQVVRHIKHNPDACLMEHTQVFIA